MIVITHMFFGLALAYIFKLPKLPVLLTSLALDLDVVFGIMGLGFPFMHRGLVHTPIFILVITTLWYYGRKRDSNALGLGLGGLSHLLLDFITNEGIMLLYPLPVFFVLPIVSYANIFANAGIILLSVAIVLIYHYKPRLVQVLGKKESQRMILMFLIFVILTIVISYISSFIDISIWDPFIPYY
jgi:membrane-bound metal-dependent hydrolase YbcI (DUF457 family)